MSILLLLGAAVGVYMIVHPPKPKICDYIAANTGANKATLIGYDYKYLLAWYKALKGKAVTFMYSSKQYSSSTGRVIQ